MTISVSGAVSTPTAYAKLLVQPDDDPSQLLAGRFLLLDQISGLASAQDHGCSRVGG
jgi:hypothetical protein